MGSSRMKFGYYVDLGPEPRSSTLSETCDRSFLA